MTRGGYNTRQREELEGFLQKHPAQPFTAQELSERLGIGRTTAYRQLERLLREGAVRRFQEEDGKSASFQYVGDASRCAEHMHCRCDLCGRLYHVDCEVFLALREHLLLTHGFQIDGEKTVILGRCENCRGAREE